MFANTIYVQIYPNRFELRQIESGKSTSVSSAKPFTTERLLVGQFSEAHAALSSEMIKFNRGKWLSLPPKMVLHPMEKTEGGLSEIEERILKELAMGAGAKKAIVWVGHALSDQEVISRANSV